MNAIVVTGFRGTGKTTLLSGLANRIAARGDAVVIMENERGRAVVDGPYRGTRWLAVEPIPAGCVCCDQAGSLMLAIRVLRRRYDPTWMFLEAGGAAHADELRRTLDGPEGNGVDWTFVALLDVARFVSLWSERYGLGVLVRPQLAQADLLVLTGADQVNRDRVLATLAAVRALRPDVPVLVSSAQQPAVSGLLRALDQLVGTQPGAAFDAEADEARPSVGVKS